METKFYNTSELKRHPKNPRKIKDSKLDELCLSLEKNPEFFWSRPLIIDKEKTIWAGNSRFLASKKIGLKKVPCIMLDLPEEKLQEIMIRDNTNSGEWDSLLLNEWKVENLIEWGINIDSRKEQIDYNNEPGKKKAKKVKLCPHCGIEL